MENILPSFINISLLSQYIKMDVKVFKNNLWLLKELEKERMPLEEGADPFFGAYGALL